MHKLDIDQLVELEENISTKRAKEAVEQTQKDIRRAFQGKDKVRVRLRAKSKKK